MKVFLTVFVCVFVLGCALADLEFVQTTRYAAIDSSCSNSPLSINAQLSGATIYESTYTCTPDGTTVEINANETLAALTTGQCLTFEGYYARFDCVAQPIKLKNYLLLLEYSDCWVSPDNLVKYSLEATNQCISNPSNPSSYAYMSCSFTNSVEYIFDASLPANSSDSYCPGALIGKRVNTWTENQCVGGFAQVYDCL
ncbi:hypothetical protein CYY_008694 [Polysphondylium violaceum]|uniref:MRH domain-containing protein n=1 Tax=Polysphondylium violaceum TaxID=133409 RepID=A0A8J4V122_9MYCE|nr:hypothetical protein CYY_008694 [Polysphondylium violaceum]